MSFGKRKIIDRRVFLDIETTGYSAKKNNVTIVGVLNNGKFTQYIDTIDLLPNVFEEYIKKNCITEIIGYNSVRFDVPFLVENNFVGAETIDSLIMTDLMHNCHKLGIKGGLKKTEEFFNIARKLEPLDFKQQMSLWRRFVHKKDKKILTPLLTYNEDDVKNLVKLERCIIDYGDICE